MIPSEVPIGLGHAYYPTEVAYVEGCQESRLTGFTSDGRYKKLGFEATVHDVQVHSGVIDTLTRQPLSFQQYSGWGGINAAKKAVNTEYFGRQIIEWDIECETRDGLDRASIVDLMQYATKQEDDKNNYYITASMTVAVIMIAVFGCLCSCGMLMSASIISSGSANAIALAPPICTILCTGSGAFAVFGCLRWAVDFMNVKEKKLTSYTRFAQCSSEYLTI